MASASYTVSLTEIRFRLTRCGVKNWVIPFASLIPILAIVFAFSLGPSPAKVFETSSTVEELLEIPATDMVPAVGLALQQTESAQRDLAITYLEKVALSDQETALVRSRALDALEKVAPARAAQHRRRMIGALQ